MACKVEPKSPAELEAMHTGSLMSRRKALLKCEKKAPASYQAGTSEDIEFKDTPEWRRAYAELKAVLSRREHRPSKHERKAIRQAKAKK